MHEGWKFWKYLCKRRKLATFSRLTKGSREAASEEPAVIYISVFAAFYNFQVADRSTSPDMTTVFHASSYGRFIEI